MLVVLFSATPREDLDVGAYRHTSARMRELAAAIPGFISCNTYTADSGEGSPWSALSQGCRCLRKRRLAGRDHAVLRSARSLSRAPEAGHPR